jgi:PhnB protein
MQTRLDPYLSFKDNAREAMEFYNSVFGGKLDIQTFKQYGISDDPAEDDKIMHINLAESMLFFL